MRERITFVHGPEDAFDPDQIQLKSNALYVKSLRAAREDRVTASLYELPQELWRALKQCHELHIRWVSGNPFQSIPPFVSTVSPGLHIFFTPQKNRSAYVSKIIDSYTIVGCSAQIGSDLLCPLLQKTFGGSAKCTFPEDSFTRLPMISERFSSSAAYQYWELLSSLEGLVTYIQQKVCGQDELCKVKANALNHADYLDVDYDTISQSLVLNAFWHASPDSDAWEENISIRQGSTKVEVGVLANEKPTQPEELSLGGFLTILGEDAKPNPTLFSFPSRHHVYPSTSGANYSASYMQPTGLHPTLRLTLPSLTEPPSQDCALHTYLTLPASLFPDKYQLSAPNFLASNNLRSIRALSGELDLEAPIWAVSKWGSALLLELAPPDTESAPWHADIPLHLRYLRPTSGGETLLFVPWPVVFWACSSDEGTKMNNNPFDRVNLGYDGLFGPRTMFYHLQPANRAGRLVEELKVPVLNIDGLNVGWVDYGTVMIVLLGFSWVCWILGRVLGKDLGIAGASGRGKTD